MAFWNWSLEHGYRQGLSLDRTDNDGPYSPDNCRWVDRLAQANNMRSNRRVAIFGDVRTVAEWARDLRCRVARRQLQKRIDSGWTPEIALLTPAAEDYLVTAFGETKTIYGWSRDRRCTVSNDALRNRLNKAGWPPELAISLPRQNWRTMVKIPSSDPPS